jgi:hypothetical protein
MIYGTSEARHSGLTITAPLSLITQSEGGSSQTHLGILFHLAFISCSSLSLSPLRTKLGQICPSVLVTHPTSACNLEMPLYNEPRSLGSHVLSLSSSHPPVAGIALPSEQVRASLVEITLR